jgi:proteasome lid subunit RPN8/RPN11
MEIGELEISAPIEKTIPVSDPSCVTEAMGVIAPQDLKIFIPRRILQQIVDFSASDIHHEVGGFMIGDLYSHRGVQYIEIEGYIEAEHAIQTAASLRFTHDTFESRTRRMDREFPDRKVVGWHHTHPGYGVFLSSTDTYTHGTHFNLPWMVALVVDPRAGQMGFFQWRKGQLLPCGFYFVENR